MYMKVTPSLKRTSSYKANGRGPISAWGCCPDADSTVLSLDLVTFSAKENLSFTQCLSAKGRKGAKMRRVAKRFSFIFF